MKRTYSTLISLFLVATFGANAYAAACTYDEAILALQQGNAVRGLALIRMAAQDGDQRATDYLASRPLLKNSTSVPHLAEHRNTEKFVSKNNSLIAYREIQ